MAAVVNAIDAQIDRPPTPVLRGTTGDFEGFVSEGSTLMRHITPGGESTVRNVPTWMLTPKVRAAFYDLYCAIEAAETSDCRPVV
jgi:hypothetical protein